ncbi:hypothetical protein [Streptomyces sp. NPDC004065]|uniref:hypothetical protein n=1 Tax=Streptomyces sp. NPDC004065 TaxID=3364689 RepID=UPI003850E85F
MERMKCGKPTTRLQRLQRMQRVQRLERLARSRGTRRGVKAARAMRATQAMRAARLDGSGPGRARPGMTGRQVLALQALAIGGLGVAALIKEFPGLVREIRIWRMVGLRSGSRNQP